MIRFIDLTVDYWGLDGDDKEEEDTYRHICAFLSTITDKFIEAGSGGGHIFETTDEVDSIPGGSSGGFKSVAERCRNLVPDGFFGGAK